jgi:hypothetical protein
MRTPEKIEFILNVYKKKGFHASIIDVLRKSLLAASDYTVLRTYAMFFPNIKK